VKDADAVTIKYLKEAKRPIRQSLKSHWHIHFAGEIIHY
jgi:hypothetical protein